MLEAHNAVTALYRFEDAGELSALQQTSWETRSFLFDRRGRRLLEEVARRVRTSADESDGLCGLAVTMPGTIHEGSVIISSSRLGIRERIDAGSFLSNELGIPTRVYHDVECLAVGEDMYGEGGPAGPSETFAYVFADEGVGSKLLINGRTHLGAGAAGILGRLIVQPDGAFYKKLASRGPLEVFASRPWVSENLVALFLSEERKANLVASPIEATLFRKALRTAAGNDDWSVLQYVHIADGLKQRDPIASDVCDVAARYLGLALNSVITIVHPHRIVLGGGLITELPGFANQVISYARRFSWANAWNATAISVSGLGREAQLLGAAELWRREA